MRRSRPLWQTLMTLLVAALAVLALVACDDKLAVRHTDMPLRTDTPLRVSATWWSPTALQAGIRSLHGRVENATDSVWSNVQVSIEFTDPHGESLYVRTVAIGSVEPRASLEFATGSLPEQPTGYAIRGLSGMSVTERRRVVAR